MNQRERIIPYRTMKFHPCLLIVAAMFAAFILGSNLHAQPLVNIETVLVGDPGNAADTRESPIGGINHFGAVAEMFSIGKYEVSINQYSTFLNSVASVTSDSYIVNLWNANMTSDLNIAGISRSGAGTLGSPYSYSVIGSGNRPITYVGWFDAARFANWMNNGAINGASTETGAYTLNGATSGVGFTKNAGATWWIPSEDEWYKAAYYKGGGTDAGYWDYPTQSDTTPTAQANPPGAQNSANFNGVRPVGNLLTEVGAFSTSPSAYGTFDQAGNVWEWNDAVSGSERGSRGGSYFGDFTELQSGFRGSDPPTGEYNNEGFRVASVPEPSTYALLFMTGAGALWWARRRR